MNGLGFVSRSLYLFSQFFEDKGVESNYINDDKIGRVMIEIVLLVVNKFEIETKYAHLYPT